MHMCAVATDDALLQDRSTGVFDLPSTEMQAGGYRARTAVVIRSIMGLAGE